MSERLGYNPHAGDILKHAFIDEISMNATQLARKIDIKPKRIYDVINGTQEVDSDIDLRLCQYFDLSQGYFLRLQECYEEAKKRWKKFDSENSKKTTGTKNVSERLVHSA